MIVSLSAAERLNMRYILPVQGNYRVLELTDAIMGKLDEAEGDNSEIDFSDAETEMLLASIDILDANNKLPYQAFSVIRKFKETTK